MPSDYKEMLQQWGLVSDQNDSSQRTFLALFVCMICTYYTHRVRQMVNVIYQTLKTENDENGGRSSAEIKVALNDVA